MTLPLPVLQSRKEIKTGDQQRRFPTRHRPLRLAGRGKPCLEF
jgi:hypothetical protein